MMVTSAQRALVLSPHPDDESFGCGGIIKRMTAAGGQVDVAFLTRGELGNERGLATHCPQSDLAARRTAEAREACRILGVHEVIFLNGRDGYLQHQPELHQEILSLLQSDFYRTVFGPGPNDNHPDHQATFQMLTAALSRCQRDVDVWLYEVWSPLTPNMVVPIDQTMEAKEAAMRAHQSQTELADYVSAFRGLAQYRSLWFPTSTYAEAFLTCQVAELTQQRQSQEVTQRP
jgi:LmbE family N-acetylglucosaminyl deacetylase